MRSSVTPFDGLVIFKLKNNHSLVCQGVQFADERGTLLVHGLRAKDGSLAAEDLVVCGCRAGVVADVVWLVTGHVAAGQRLETADVALDQLGNGRSQA